MITTDFSIKIGQDAILTITMVPPVPIGGWSIYFWCGKRFGSDTPIIEKWYASGYSAVSGITLINSGEGILNVRLNSIDTSGIDPGNYANGCKRITSGAITPLTEGYMQATY